MMNRKIQYIYSIGLLLFLLVSSCSKRDTPADPVAIRLYTGILTRSAVDVFHATPVCIACGISSGAYTQTWEGIATADEITLTPVRYYPEDGSGVYLRGYYPPAPMSADGTLSYTLTGDEDLLLSDEQNGSLSSPFTPAGNKQLIYGHLLTKLSFIIHLEGDDVPSLRVRSLQLNGLAGQVTLTLTTGSLSYGESTVPVTIHSTPDDSEGLPFVEGVLQLPGYVLVQPQAEFTLDMVLSVDDDRSHDLAYHDLAVSFEGGGGEGGAAYTVKVELPSPTQADPLPVKVTTTVVSWQAGDSGSGHIPGWDTSGDAK
ncbi:fimbrillin family protein [Bacteroides oleiciplenus]|uniref:Fimbrillin family protein n=1 Tax=Bacteroides oleiciplenus YIT 12058 TaxID=742727 RepID=K9DY51_9BACE|nr:fimbrillin family protein [Bacteroides oleiciplenus]EKU89914.1 hypothetical protein HMPREF9447_03352 [Bacteroides oleiciplenus YIT 12058]